MLTEESFVARVWAPLEAAYGSQPAERMRLYRTVLVGRVDETAIVRAALHCVEHSRWFPTVAELRDAAGLNVDTLDGQRAWEAVREYVLCSSLSERPELDDRARAALRAIGGHERLRLCATVDTGHLRREFLETYARHLEGERQGALLPAHAAERGTLERPVKPLCLPAPVETDDAPRDGEGYGPNVAERRIGMPPDVRAQLVAAGLLDASGPSPERERTRDRTLRMAERGER